MSAKALLCPECRRILYDRRRKTCGYCNAALPKELMFTESELKALEEREIAGRLQRLERELAAEKERVRQLGGDDTGPFYVIE